MNLCWCLFVITPNESLEICFTVPKTCFQTIKDKLNVSALLQCWLVPVLLLNKHSLNHSRDTRASVSGIEERCRPFLPERELHGLRLFVWPCCTICSGCSIKKRHNMTFWWTWDQNSHAYCLSLSYMTQTELWKQLF